MDRNPRLKIEKVDISWFKAIKTEKTIEFATTFNVVYGEESLKQSIAKAIDCLLCPEFADGVVALLCRHEQKSLDNNRESSVTLHLTSVDGLEFTMNGKNCLKCSVTRYFNVKDVNYVFYAGQHKRQAISEFHQNLANNSMLRLLDPVINNETMLTSFDLNGLLTSAHNMSNLKNEMQQIKVIQDIELEVHDNNGILQKNFINNFDQAKKVLIPYRTTTYALNQMKIDRIMNEHPEIKNIGKMRAGIEEDYGHLNISYLIGKVKAMLNSRYDVFEIGRKDLVDMMEIVQAKVECRQLIMEKFEESVRQFRLSLTTDENALEIRRKIISDNYKHNLMVTLREVVVRRSSDMNRIQGYIEQSRRAINAYEKSNPELVKAINRGHQTVKKISDGLNAKIEEVKTAMVSIARSWSRYLEHNLNSLRSERDLAECYNHYWGSRVKIDDFCFRQRFLPKEQISGLMMGIHILTSFDTPVSVESFLGIIGDFIDPNNDRAIDLLPVVIPILAKRDLTTFIFKTHQDAVKFCEYFKTCSRQDFFIRALGIDKLKEIPHDAPYESLADTLLTDQVRNQHVFMKNYFDTFRVVRDDGIPAATCKEIAQEGKFKIFRGNCYYDERATTTVMGGKLDVIQNYLHRWSEMKEERLQTQANVPEIVDFTKMQKKNQTDFDHAKNELFERQLALNILLTKFREQLIKFPNLRTEHNQLIMTYNQNNVQIECRKQFLAWAEQLQRNDRDFVLPHDIEIRQVPEMPCNAFNAGLEIFAAIREVAHCAYGSCEIGNFPEIFQELNEHMHIRRLNFQDILQEPVKKVQNIELEERNRENFALEKIYESLKQLSGVCNEIEEFPEYFAQGNLPDLQNLTEDELSVRLRRCKADIPIDMILPGPDLSRFVENYRHLTDFRGLQPETAQNFQSEVDEHQMEFIKQLYWGSLKDILVKLNQIYQTENQTIVFEVDTGDRRKFYIDQDDEYANEWAVDVPWQTLCAKTTGFRFKYKSTDGEIFVSEQLDIRRNEYARLFHALVSSIANTSLLMLNNTTIGLEHDEFLPIFHTCESYDDVVKQVIVFWNSEGRAFGLFKDRRYRQIVCANSRNVQSFTVTDIASCVAHR